MNITEIRIKLVSSGRDKLRAYASLTLDETLVIRDLKIIEGENGLFVAMPSRKLHQRCHACGGKNVVRARYCNDCGARQIALRTEADGVRSRLYADIAHPIHQAGRDLLQRRVLSAYYEELGASRRVGYVPQHFEDLDYHLA
jgi:stage V sporulation protein G